MSIPFPFTILNLCRRSRERTELVLFRPFFLLNSAQNFPQLPARRQMHYFCFSLCFSLHSNNKFISSPVNIGFHHNKIRICQSKVFRFIPSCWFASKIVWNNFGFHFFLLFEMSLCGETFSRLFTIGLSQICLWISITVKWIFCEAASTGHANYLLIR